MSDVDRRTSLVRQSYDSQMSKGFMNNKINGKLVNDNVEEDSENLSNVSDDELNHNTKIDESL